MASPKPNNALIMRPVDAPPAVPARRTLYVDVVTQMADQPGQWFHVRTCNSPQSAQSARSSIVKAASRLGLKAEASAAGADVYAKVNKKPGRRAGARS